MDLASHRSCGAWIEMDRAAEDQADRASRIAHAVRGLKYEDVRKECE